MLRFKNILISFLLSAALFGGMLWLTASLFTLEISFMIPAAIGAVVIMTCSISSLLGKSEWIIPTAWLVLIFLSAVLFWNRLADGFAQLLNEIMDTYKQVRPRNYEIFTVNDLAGINYATAELAALLAVGCAEFVKRRSCAFGWLTTASLVALCAVFLPVISASWLVAAALFLLLVWFIAAIYKKQRINLVARWTVLKSWLRTAVVFLLIFAAFGSVLGIDNKPKPIRGLSEAARNWIDDLRYGSTENTGLAEGDLSKVGTRQAGTETMLKVTMSEPTSYYLRGFVGEVYQDNRWSALSRKTLYDNGDVFNALHQSGFYAQSQIATAADMLDEGIVQYQNSVQIENVGLPSKYLYAPYELLPWSLILDKGAIGDGTVLADGFTGQRKFSFTAANNLVVQYQKIAALLQQKRDNGGASDYLKNEAAYNQFVYEQYTALPSDIDSYLAEKLGSYAIEEGQIHFDYQKAKQNILYYLTDSVAYSENVGAVEDGIDFILNFLDGTKSGYDVHYASAAAMLFRYYGIPARYVEGYVVTKEDAANAAPGDTLFLDSSHAHAWVEYYQDGVGWLPFEVTPTYLSVMEQADTYQDVSGLVGQAPENEVIDAIQPDTVTEEEPPLLLSFWLKNKLTILLVFALLVLVVLIVLFVLWLIRERQKTAKRKQRFLDADIHLAICEIFMYLLDVMVANGLESNNQPPEACVDFLDQDLQPQYLQSVSIWQEAKFSVNEMTEMQRRQVLSLQQELWNRTWQNASATEKLKLKFMYFL